MRDDDRVIRIENKIDTISDKISSIDSTLAAQHVSLKEHIKRTNLLERALEDTKQELQPIKTHVNMVTGGIKFFGLLALTVSWLVGIIEMYIFIKRG